MGLINTLRCLHFPFQLLCSAPCLLLNIRAAGFKVVEKGASSKFCAHRKPNPHIPLHVTGWFSVAGFECPLRTEGGGHAPLSLTFKRN